MKRIVIPRTSLESSRVGFGTASLHHLATANARSRLLSVAYDKGITHFDTARMYGDGIAERALGGWLQGRSRHAVTIATKCGILPNRLAERFPAWAYLRRAKRLLPTACHRESQAPRSYTPNIVLQSVEQSLRLLRTDYIDILFIHDPRPEDLSALHDLSRVLTELKQSGKVRWTGIAGDAIVCVQAHELVPGLFDVLQVGDSLSRCEADALTRIAWPRQITFGYLRHAFHDEQKSRDAALEIMRQAMQRNPQGVVLASSRSATRLQSLIEASSAE